MEGATVLYGAHEIHGADRLHHPEGESVTGPQAPSATVLAAGRPAAGRRNKTTYLDLRPEPLRRAAGRERVSDALFRQADWAAQLYRQRIYGTTTSQPHVLAAERDICGLILNCMGRRKDLFEQFLTYLEGEAWYYRGGGVRGEPKTYWHKVPWLLYREWFYWWTNGRPEEKKVGELRALKKEDLPWNECLGCLLSGEDDAMTTPRCPGAEHRRGCLYERPGHIGADDWRISRLVEHLRKQEENA